MEIKIRRGAFKKIEVLKNKIIPFISKSFQGEFEFDDTYAEYNPLLNTLSIDIIIDGVSIPFRINASDQVLISLSEDARDFDFIEMTEANFWKALYFFKKIQS